MDIKKEKEFCRKFLKKENFCYGNFELHINRGVDLIPDGSFWVCYPHCSQASFICAGDTFEEAKKRAMSFLNDLKKHNNIDDINYAFNNLCSYVSFEGRTIIYCDL